jgi:protein-export membrane protein SecD
VAEQQQTATTTTTRPSGSGELVLADEDGTRLRLGPAPMTGDAVGDAGAVLDAQTGTRWEVQIEFRGDGGAQWAKLTGQAACAPDGDPRRRVAIVLDQRVISSPQVDPSVACGQGIRGGPTVITGSFSDREARDLALLIRAGALPVPVEVIAQRTVGPTLGEAAIRASVQAAVLGAALTTLFMLAYYRLLGGLAALALLCYGLLSFAVLLALRSTLTLPGIAGFVLAIGMAVDANVLVFERAKEEYAASGKLRPAFDRGFSKAFSAIADSNMTTLLAAGLLFFLASGAVRGFGVTLSVGVVVSLFTALVVTRALVELAVRIPPLRARPGVLGLETGGRLRDWLEGRGPDLIGRAPVAGDLRGRLRHRGRRAGGAGAEPGTGVHRRAAAGIPHPAARRPRRDPPRAGRCRLCQGGGPGIRRHQPDGTDRPAHRRRRAADRAGDQSGRRADRAAAGGVHRADHRRGIAPQGADRAGGSPWPRSLPTWRSGSAGRSAPPR